MNQSSDFFDFIYNDIESVYKAIFLTEIQILIPKKIGYDQFVKNEIVYEVI